jgi:adenosine deaminase
MKNILVTSLGISWSIVPELLGFTNSKEYPLYKNHNDLGMLNNQISKYDIEAVEEVWIVTTNGKKVSETIDVLNSWSKYIDLNVKYRVFSYSILIDLNTIDEIIPMSDLVYRVVLHAKEESNGGKLYLSLSGGRKNMSADIQNAANIFGCDALIHVMDNGDISKEFIFRDKTVEQQVLAFSENVGKEISCFTPVVIQNSITSSPIIFADEKITSTLYTLEESLRGKYSTALYSEIVKRRRQSANSLLSLYKKSVEEKQTNYRAFQLLSPEIVEKLHDEKIGLDIYKKEEDLEWLSKLPKAELHCHFGGILSPEEIIEAAKENSKEIFETINENKEFGQWCAEIGKAVRKEDFSKLPSYNPKKNIKEYWLERGIPEPLAISAFILAFENNHDLLKNYIFCSTGDFKRIGIDAYEKLGDLQGSSLLQNEATIRKTCQLLVEQCKRDNIKYCEVRCSPVNYTRGGLNADQVVETMMDELKNNSTIFKLIFIASRHGKSKQPIIEHIDLAVNLIESNETFKNMFVGFDLAGAEEANSPKQLRETFMAILERSIPTTIHAGEDMTVKNIWEAIYHLSAERIGHGLTLNDDENLKKRIRERKIAIELCPSSNDQIIGYHDYFNSVDKYKNKEYPLKGYLDSGLKITINTDDPGISLTNLTSEYYKAATMTKGGLSKWEILQINRNGFKYGFLPLEEKKKLLIDVETELFEILNSK